MIYSVIQMMSGKRIFISEQEFKNLQSASGLTYVPSQNRFINLSSVETITPIEQAITEERLEGKRFFNSKGEQLVLNKGEWVNTDGTIANQKLTTIEMLARGQNLQLN